MSDDAEHRFRVWYALADLFLDTETTPETYAWIVRTLKESGYDKAKLRHIFADEVAPAFIFNLLDIAGEWAGWTDAFVRDQMTRPAQSLRPDERQFMKKVVDEEWAKLEPLLG